MNHNPAGIDGERLARVGVRIEADIAAGRYDGAALRVGRGGQELLDLRLGWADRANARPLGADDVFVSMSIGKQFTNVLALERVERGLMSLDMQVAELLPAFRKPGLRAVTLFHLLTHTSGILASVPSLPPEVLMDTARFTAYIAALPLQSRPGERVNYSILAAHAVIGEMLKAVDGGERSLSRIMAEDLFAPLGMHSTSLGGRDDLLPRVCPVVARYSERGLFDPAELEGLGQLIQLPGCEIPAGGFLTSIDDLHRFTHMLLAGGEIDGVRLLSPRTLDYCSGNFTADKPNVLFDYTRAARGWEPWPANIGIGFFVRGGGITPGPISNFSSPATLCGWGAGSSGFWADRRNDLCFSFLSTGLMEDSHHIQRLQRLSDLVVCSLTD
jgi:CubicO group peptidase (beta-lactamase class C family)